MEAWFTLAWPPVTKPSSGIMPPVRTMISSPAFTSSIGTSTSCGFPPSSAGTRIQTLLMFRDMDRARSLTDFLWVHSSRISPIRSMNMMEPAVPKLPRARATLMAAASSTGTSSFPLSRHAAPFFKYPMLLKSENAMRSGAGRNICRSALSKENTASAFSTPSFFPL